MRHLLLWLALQGCTYHVRVESRPIGAVLWLEDGSSVVLPQDVDLPWRPFKPPKARVTFPGYRTLETRFTRRLVKGSEYLSDPFVAQDEAFGDKPRRVLEVVLVPEHGPAGTWTEDEVDP